VVEVEYQEVGLAAIDTWVFQQEFHETAQVLGLIHSVVPPRVGNVHRAIPRGVATVPGFVARSAEGVQQARASVLDVYSLASLFWPQRLQRFEFNGRACHTPLELTF